MNESRESKNAEQLEELLLLTEEIQEELEQKEQLINASRLFSVLYHRTLNIGRVQTPTLAMLADRDGKIVLFRKEKYHHVRLALEGAEAVSDRIVSPEDAQAIRDACDGQRAVCVSLVREKKTEKPPKLYDLTTLQREANRVFGYTAKQTLDYAQSLYEKKLLTYPRTDSRHLTGDMAETASVVLHLAARVPPFDACPEFFPDVAALVNDKEVSDHHALIPTLELEKADVPALPVGERNILLLVCCKLLCAAAEPFVYEVVTAAFECGGYTFTAKGKQVLSQGWRAIQEVFRSSLKEKPEDEDAGGVLPALTEGQVFEPVTASVTEHFTSPPRPYTEDSLLAAMENAGKEDIPEDAERRGLGTPATRAAIIEKLVSGGFVERKGKNLIPTKAGVNLVTVLPELLTSPKLTADWEQRLNEVAKGQASPEDFMDGIEAMAAELVRKYVKEIDPGLHALQAEVGGDIAASYPFDDPVGLVLNDEGKLIGLDLNRSLRDEHGEIYDIVAGTFLVVGLGEESFTSLPPELAQKYMEHFKQPEQFINLNGQIVALPVEPENPLRTAEMTLEDDYGMIDGIINNGRRGEELEKAQAEARRTTPEKKPSIRERLEDAKRECAEQKGPDKPAPQKKPPELGDL